MKEIWKKLELNGYYPIEVSSFGRVKALEKFVKYSDGRNRRYKEYIMTPRFDSKGYYQICLHGENCKKEFRVHRLVAEAFIKNIENKPCVNHKDGNRKNNNVSNLEWVTYSENTKDGIYRGSIYKPGKKINLSDSENIRTIYQKTNLKQREIASMFNLTQTQISRIIRNKNWFTQ
jgi:hypothetical protein